MNKTLVIGVCSGLVLTIGCSSEKTRYPNGKPSFKHVSLHCVYNKGDRDASIIYCFATSYPGAIKVTLTTDQEAKPDATGVFWFVNAKDGLWLNGSKLSIPEGYKIIAIRDDGIIVPVQADAAELAHLAGERGVISDMPELETRLESALIPPKN